VPFSAGLRRDCREAMSLKASAFAGVRWTTFSSLTNSMLQLLQVVILARWLAPADFGLIAVVLAIMAFLQIFADLGVSNAIIHYRDISPMELSSLYWLNVGASAVLALGVVGLSPCIASFYAEPALQSLLILAALALLIASLGQQLRVVAQKNLRFGALARVEVAAGLAGFATAVGVALLGGGVYALIAGVLAAAVMGSLLVWLLLAEGWRPQLRLRVDEIGRFVQFGAYMIGNNLANAVNSQIDILLGGRLLGPQSMGLYSVPKELSLRVAGIINPIVTQVGLPVMSKVQGDPALLRSVYLQTMRTTASVNFPIYIALWVFAPEVVQVALGAQWQAAIPLLQVFAWWGLLRSTGNPVGSLLMAVGRADLSFRWNMTWLFITPPVVWVGSQFGAQGMTLAMVGLAVLSFVPNWYFLVRPLCGARMGEYCAQLAVPVALSLAAGSVGYISASIFSSPIARLVAGVVMGGTSYMLLSYRFNSQWCRALAELFGVRVLPLAGPGG